MVIIKLCLDVVRKNPDFDAVQDYYEHKFGFDVLEILSDKIIMEKEI